MHRIEVTSEAHFVFWVSEWRQLFSDSSEICYKSCLNQVGVEAMRKVFLGGDQLIEAKSGRGDMPNHLQGCVEALIKKTTRLDKEENSKSVAKWISLCVDAKKGNKAAHAFISAPHKGSQEAAQLSSRGTVRLSRLSPR